jgi:tripartite-type tricarboxylate transporter receptor subunit TctC
MKNAITLGAAAFAVTALVTVGSAQAGFPEKDITFVIPYGPGGGFDTYVRKISPVLARYLPNKVNVVPKNVSGGGGRKALAKLYRDKPDGYTISIFNMPGMMLDKILGKKASFDIERFSWVGRVGLSTYVLTRSAKSKFKSVKDLSKGKTAKYAITSYSSGSYVAGRIMSEAMGMKMKFLPGYTGSAAISLSMARGDTDVSLFNSASAGKWAKSGEIKLMMSLEKKSPWKDVPTARSLGHPELELLTVGRFVGGPPGMKPEVVKILSDALEKALADKEIQAWSKKTRRPVNPLSGSNSAKALDEIVKFFGNYKEALAKR